MSVCRIIRRTIEILGIFATIMSKTCESIHCVRCHSLVLFYKARILSVLLYAAPFWFPHTSQNDKVKLERFQKLCTRIMISYEEEYEERLSLPKLEELNIHLDVLCLKYIAKVRDYDDHPCKKFLKDQDHLSINRTSFIHSNLFHKYTSLLCCLFSFQFCVMLGLI